MTVFNASSIWALALTGARQCRACAGIWIGDGPACPGCGGVL